VLTAPAAQNAGLDAEIPLDNRAALTGIIFVMKSGIPWEMLPLEMGCGCGMTCWRRLRDWQAAGVWQRLREVLLAKLGFAACGVSALCMVLFAEGGRLVDPR
jgi:transposase